MNKFTLKFISFLLPILLSNISYSQQSLSAVQENVPQFLYGIASWYGDDFNGKKTASGEIYSPNALTAAHRSLPFGTKVEVENLSNGKKVEVIINDRGPFQQNRIMDLSKQAADIIGILQDGTSFVKVTIKELGTGLPTPVSPADTPVKEDIPNNFVPPTAGTVSAKNESFDELFNDLDQEVKFMDNDDSLFASEQTAPKTQRISDIESNSVGLEPRGFVREDDIFIGDPLSNISLGSDDEFVAVPAPPIVTNSAIDITVADKNTLNREATDDPFADLFSGADDPYSFQSMMATNSMAPLEMSRSIAPHIDENKGSVQIITNTVSEPVIVTITNFQDPITNVINVPSYTYTETNIVTSNRGIPNNVTEEPMSAANVLTPPVVPQAKLGDHYIIQLGAFSKHDNAMKLYEQLRSKGFNAFITDVKLKGRNIIRVRVGHFDTVEEAVSVSDRLKSLFPLDNRIIQIEFDK